MRQENSWMKVKEGIALVLISCLTCLVQAAGKDIEVSLHEKRIQEISSDGLLLSFLARVENRSEHSYFISSYKYRILVNQREYLNQNVSLENERLEVKPGEKSILNFPVRLSYRYLKTYLTEGQKQGNCLVAGEIFFVGEKKKIEKVPFEWSMSFPVFKIPELKFLPLQIKDLTIGGAEFRFVFALINENPYDVLIQDLGLELILGGKVIYSGRIAGDKTLEAEQEKIFQIPLILDFFEQGRELRDQLEQEKPEFRLKAQVTADSAWGVLNFSVERSAGVEKEFKR